MSARRNRLGLIVPSSNTTNEPEFRAALPDRVSLHASRMELEKPTSESLERMAREAERCAELLATADVDVVAYGCTTGSLIEGPGFDEELESRLADAAGVPAVVTAASIKRAFEALGLSSLSIATPYVDELNERERVFLDAAGYSIVEMVGLGIEMNLDIGSEHPERMYRLARDVDRPDADGVFVSCTNSRTFEIVPTLEADLDKPVVTSNRATLWDALERIDIRDVTLKLGSLFDE